MSGGDSVFYLRTNHRVNPWPPVTGSISEKADIMYTRVEQATIGLRGRWMCRHDLAGVSGIGRTAQNPVVKHLLGNQRLEVRDYNGQQYLRVLPVPEADQTDIPDFPPRVRDIEEWKTLCIQSSADHRESDEVPASTEADEPETSTEAAPTTGPDEEEASAEATS